MKITFAEPSDTYHITLTASEIIDLVVDGAIMVRPEHTPSIFRNYECDSNSSGGHKLSYKDCHTSKAKHVQFLCISMDREEES